MIISEIFPNPVGKDADGEWIELFNNGASPASLRGWAIVDASGKKFVFGDRVISSGQYIVLPYSETKISLNNQGEIITLFDQNGAAVSELSFQGVSQEGWSVVNNGGLISFSSSPTPGGANEVGADKGQFSELVETQANTRGGLPAANFQMTHVNVFLMAFITACALGIGGVWIVSKYRHETP